MLKKIILLLIISSITVCGFAQKSKRKAPPKSPKSDYFVMTINGETTLADDYCPKEDILFSFIVSDSSILEKEFHWKWYAPFHDSIPMHDDLESITYNFPITPGIVYPNKSNYFVYLIFEIQTPTDSATIKDTLTLVTEIFLDVIRTTVLETSVCYGRDITITMLNGDTTFYDVKAPITVWDKLESDSGCDSLLGYFITVDPLIELEYSISSCDSVKWGEIVVKRPDDYDPEVDYTIPVERYFYVPLEEQEFGCDTLIILNVTIIGKPKLEIVFDQEAFCSGDDMQGTIELETNFTAFDWTFNIDKNKAKDRDTTFTVFEPSLDIEYSGYYRVLAYMDTNLYDTLTDLRIVNCFLIDSLTVEDCELIIPNVITPNDDGVNDILGIKKLNPERDNELTIYDRWGKKVFQQRGYKCVFKGNSYENIEEAFDGLTKEGQKLPDGTYYYAFTYDALLKEKSKGKTFYSGTIIILR
jgi:gliding motility-associated-like protein